MSNPTLDRLGLTAEAVRKALSGARPASPDISQAEMQAKIDIARARYLNARKAMLAAKADMDSAFSEATRLGIQIT